jgi:hypothetical protein
MKLEEVNLKTKEAVNYLVQSLEAGQSSVLTQYLGAMAKFRNYSFGNIMLIARQKDHAAFGYATCRRVFDANARDRSRDVAPRRPSHPDD